MPTKPRKTSKHKLKPHLQSLRDKAQGSTRPRSSSSPPSRAATDNSSTIFFFRPDAINGYLCQWYPVSFIDPTTNISFSSAEQYMMYQKALHFSDFATASSILSVTSPRRQKGLARKIEGFDEDVWRGVKEDVVENGNWLKFSQNEDLRELLMATGETELAEASPFDRVWGIGFAEEEAVGVGREEWGMNLLGKCLMRVRERLRMERTEAQATVKELVEEDADEELNDR